MHSSLVPSLQFTIASFHNQIHPTVRMACFSYILAEQYMNVYLSTTTYP